MIDDLERLKRRYFLLRGWARYLAERMPCERKRMEHCKRFRARGNFGIVVEDDDWALQYQRLNFRCARAERAVRKDISRVYNFDTDGPLTLNIFGVSIPGWQAEPEDVAQKRDFDNFDNWYREKAVRAKRSLTQRGVPAEDISHPANAVERALHYEEMAAAGAYY